jgi:hypothetical protein
VGLRMKRQWLLWISGAQPKVLDQCPSESIKFESLGWAIMITSGLATISMWFALDSAMGVNPVIATPIALLWGLAIMGIDRWLITSMPPDGQRRFWLAAPRLALAILLGTLISTPLVLRIFESEINAQISVIKAKAESNFIQAQQGNQVGQQVTSWQKTVTNLENVINSNGAVTIDPASDPQVKTLTAQKNTAYQHEQTYYKQWNCQLYGGPGCPAGSGTLYAAAHSEWQQAQAQVNQLTMEINARIKVINDNSTNAQKDRLQEAQGALPNAEEQLKVAQDRQSALQASFDATTEQENGLLIRLQALSQLSTNDFTVAAARFLLFLLFLVIECLPVTVKLLQQPGNYERILLVLREKELSEAKRALRTSQRAARPGTSTAPPEPGTRPASETDEDVRKIWEAYGEQRTKGLRTEPPAAADDGWPQPRHQLPSGEPGRAASTDTGELPTVAHEDLMRMHDDRVSANSDGHSGGNSGGIPLMWPDDNL